MVEITKATPKDFDNIWFIFREIISTGDTYIYPPDTTKTEAKKIWMKGTRAYVAKINGTIVGTYVIRPNKTGLGSHVCNAGFMVSPHYRGKGIGRAMGLHSLKEAKKAGYLAMQFNMVVSTNVPSISLWKSLGFHIIGTVPKAFDHKQKGLVDVHIMHRFL